jgi:ATP-binding cassette subfamily F protein 3
MLDEPTNYLDIMSVIWLQNYINTISSTVVVVAHDREFVDAIAQETIILRNKTLSYFDGNLTESERHARSERKGKTRMKEAMDKKKAAIEKSIEMGIKSAKKSGDENRARMAKSRQRKLDERWGVETSAKGTRCVLSILSFHSKYLFFPSPSRFKLNRDMAGYFLTNRRELEIPELDKPIKLTFPDPDPMRFPGALISASNISFTYPGSAKKVLDDVTLTIHPGARMGLVGQNGEGKSTLVKLLIERLHPQRGKIETHPRLRLGYFDQHSVETLSGQGVAGISTNEYFIKQMKELHDIAIDEQTGRAFLGSFGLHGRTATNPIDMLSGGQKVRVWSQPKNENSCLIRFFCSQVRLALALVVYPAPHLLVLDEATTHLDKDTIVALIRALRHYTGAVLIVSHDRHFVRCVVEGAPILPPSSDAEDDYEESDEEDKEEGESGKTGTVYAVSRGKIKAMNGGVDDYVSSVEKRMKRIGLLQNSG